MKYAILLLSLAACGGGSAPSKQPPFGVTHPWPDEFFAVEADRFLGPVNVDLALRASDAVDYALSPEDPDHDEAHAR